MGMFEEFQSKNVNAQIFQILEKSFGEEDFFLLLLYFTIYYFLSLPTLIPFYFLLTFHPSLFPSLASHSHRYPVNPFFISSCHCPFISFLFLMSFLSSLTPHLLYFSSSLVCHTITICLKKSTEYLNCVKKVLFYSYACTFFHIYNATFLMNDAIIN